MILTGVSVTVLTIDSFRAYTADDISFERFATRLFNHWGIGNADRNDGILLLVAKKDRKVRIELGKGYPSSYDARAKEIIDTVIVPRDENRAPRTLVQRVEALQQLPISDPKPENPGSEARHGVCGGNRASDGKLRQLRPPLSVRGGVANFAKLVGRRLQFQLVLEQQRWRWWRRFRRREFQRRRRERRLVAG